jgi:hypothetical protein
VLLLQSGVDCTARSIGIYGERGYERVELAVELETSSGYRAGCCTALVEYSVVDVAQPAADTPSQVGQAGGKGAYLASECVRRRPRARAEDKMDEFAKRGAIAAVSLIVVAGLGVGIGVYRARAKLEHASKLASASPALAAALTFPVPVAAADTAPPPTPQVASAAKPDLASAFGAALGIDPSKVATHSAAPAASAAGAPQRAGSSDTLELGFAASDRNAKLNDRDSKAFDVRPSGGTEPEHKDKQPRERVSFVTDLGGPGGP